MVLVSAGAFLAGEDRHSETLPAFYIDRTEVPNSAYARFCQAKGRPLPPGFARPSGLPVVGITFVDAQEFAKWQASAFRPRSNGEGRSRPDGRTYPWGNEADATRATSPAAVHAGHLFATRRAFPDH